MGKIRNTKSVKAILETFETSDQALSVVELVKRFEKDMNKTTVYRILERLEGGGLLHAFSGVNGLRWYAKTKPSSEMQASNDHSHFQCQQCGKSECLHVDIPIPSLPNHRVESANLILIGDCEDCIS